VLGNTADPYYLASSIQMRREADFALAASCVSACPHTGGQQQAAAGERQPNSRRLNQRHRYQRGLFVEQGGFQSASQRVENSPRYAIAGLENCCPSDRPDGERRMGRGQVSNREDLINRSPPDSDPTPESRLAKKPIKTSVPGPSPKSLRPERAAALKRRAEFGTTRSGMSGRLVKREPRGGNRRAHKRPAAQALAAPLHERRSRAY
jgi:hypothetical protein